MRINILVFLTPVLIATLAAPALADDSQAEKILEMSRSYNSEWNCGSIQFSEDIPAFEDLTPGEQSVIGGSWLDMVLSGVQWHVMWHAGLPEMFGCGEIRTYHELQINTARYTSFNEGYWKQQLNSGWLYRSYQCPLTGWWPWLNKAEHSPGDFYMHVLSPQEESHVISLLVQHRGLSDNEVKDIKDYDIVYYRLYGESGVIAQGLLYNDSIRMIRESPYHLDLISNRDVDISRVVY